MTGKGKRNRLIAAALLLLAPHAGRAATVSGFIHGADDGEPLAYAEVFLRGTMHARIADTKGHYALAGIPAGTYVLVFQHVGYEPVTREMKLAEEDEILLTVELPPRENEVEAIEVTAEEEVLGVRHRRLSLSTKELNRIPAIIETDLLRSVQMLPGVASLSDFSAGLYVRGGSPDQNLILLDDADVYNPSHLFGFFSTFNTDAVRTVDLQKAGFPARYGGRLSSLLDVHNRDGNRKEVEGTIRTSVIASAATVEGPWAKGSWMVSARHTYIEQLAKAMDIDLPYKFYDLHGKLNWDIDENDRASLSLYNGLDQLDWDRTGLDMLMEWGNTAASLRWTHLFGSRLYTNLMIGYSRFRSTAAMAFRDLEFEMKNEIDDVCVKGNAAWTPSANHVVEFGGEVKALDFRFRRGYENEDLNVHYDGYYSALYVQDTWRVSPLVDVEAGLRLDYYNDGGYFNAGPRLSVRRRLTEALAVHATYGRYHQYLNLVSEDGAGFADMWFPVDETLDPGNADHYILGFELGPYSTFDLSVEGYYKPYRNMVQFSEEYGNSLVESDAKMGDLFDSGDGEAYGCDFYLRNRYAGFEGWLGYSLGWTKREIDGYNYGKEFYTDYDRRHNFVLMQERPLGEKWRLGVAFKYGSGQPATLPAGRYTVRDINGREYDVTLDGEMNAYRLPDYQRLDVGLYRTTKWRGMIIEPNIQVINVLNHDNVFFRIYDTSENPVKIEDVSMLPLLPMVGVRVSF
ncbi:MAG: TonB-dependent receptor [Candidatus Eisenbacteria bacterium]|nr:TonB-dependent receptor [Candidatus Eisenbacteria bacterium]